LSATPPSLQTIQLTRILRSGGRPLVVLEGVDLEVARGELLAIQGPSGSGKSTLLALLAGLDRPSSGKVLVEGREIQHLSEDALACLRRERVGFVFQSFRLLRNFTALENVLLPLELKRQPRARERASELLAEVGLAARLDHYPSQLSGGEQQRVALARAFAPMPALLFADEPTGNLDRANGEAVLDLLMKLQQERGTSVVLVTHDSALASRADRRIELIDGRIAASAGAGH
jgi:putative ABC transport system ATP-binding protein